VQRVLIVDDSAEVRQAYLEALSALGYSVSEAEDAPSALVVASQEPPDVALVDIHLPGMNGYVLARRLKALPGSADLRLVMLSGMTLDEVTRRESQAAGFDACFDKAAGPRALQALLNELP
jgi:CheY-like chemotaxis protein